MSLLFYPIIISLFSLAFAWFLISQAKKTIPFSLQGTVVKYIRLHWRAAIIAALVALVCFFLVGWQNSLGFIIGGFFALVLDFLSNYLINNARNAGPDVAKKGMQKAFELIFKNGLAEAFLAMGFSTLAVTAYYWILRGSAGLAGLCIGAGLAVLFLAITKSSSFKTGLLFQTHLVALSACMIIGQWLYPYSPQFVLLPLMISGVSLLATVLSSFFIGKGKNQSATATLYKVIIANLVLCTAAYYFVINGLMQNTALSSLFLFAASFIGIIGTLVILVAAKYQKNNLGTLITSLIIIIIGITAAFFLADLYGVALLALSLVSGAIFMQGMGFFNQTEVNIESDAKKNTSATLLYETITSGFAAVSALLAFYAQIIAQADFEISSQYPFLIGGVIIGIILPYIFMRLLKHTEVRSTPWSIALAILTPIVIALATGFILGSVALLALIVGSIATGLVLASIKSKLPILNSFIQTLPIAALLIINFLI